MAFKDSHHSFCFQMFHSAPCIPYTAFTISPYRMSGPIGKSVVLPKSCRLRSFKPRSPAVSGSARRLPAEGGSGIYIMTFRVRGGC